MYFKFRKTWILNLVILGAVNFGFVFSVWAQTDEEIENKFHNIYLKYNAKSLSENEWGQVVGDQKSKVYKINSGDNLWSVSQVLFGDPNYWPKIWGLNSENIHNPHIIDPKLEIRFYPGTAVQAPVMRLAQKTDIESKTTLTDGKKSGEPNKEGTIPEIKRKLVPIVSQLPQSLPAMKYTLEKKQSNFDIKIKSEARFKSANLDLDHFATDTDVKVIAEVIGTELELQSASDFQYVYIKSNENLQGKSLVVVKKIDKLKSLDSFKSSSLYQIQGELEVVSLANSSKGIYKALVKRIINPMEVGADVMMGVVPKFNSSGDISQLNQKVKGQIMSSYQTPPLYTTGQLIYLNIGSSDGLSSGDMLAIYPKISNHFKFLNLKKEEPIGYIKVIRVEGGVSTGFVFHATKEIYPGDWVGQMGSESMIDQMLSKDVEDQNEITSEQESDIESDFRNEDDVITTE